MNICFFSDDYIPAKTGTGVSVAMMAKELVKRGHKVVVLTTRRRNQPKYESIDGVQIYRLFSIPLFGFYQALATPGRIQKIMALHQIEVAHFHYLSLLSLFGSLVARRMGVRQVFTHHMTVDHLTQPWLMKPLKPLFKAMIRRFCSGMDLATAPSQNFVTLNKEGSPVPLFFISNPMPYKFQISPVQTPAPAASETTDDFTLLYAGRLDQEKNVSFLIRAVALAAKVQPNVKLIIAGTGREEQKLRRLVDRLGIHDKVTFLGWVEHKVLAEFYRQSQAFVLPSKVETQAIVVLEAMTFGKPIIMADSIVTATEFITEGENGIIVKGNDDKSLANAICYLARHPEEAQEMGERSRERVSSADLTVDKVVEKFERLYEVQ